MRGLYGRGNHLHNPASVQYRDFQITGRRTGELGLFDQPVQTDLRPSQNKHPNPLSEQVCAKQRICASKLADIQNRTWGTSGWCPSLPVRWQKWNSRGDPRQQVSEDPVMNFLWLDNQFSHSCTSTIQPLAKNRDGQKERENQENGVWSSHAARPNALNIE